MFAKFASLLTILLVLFILQLSEAGPIMAGSAVAFCYTACNAGYVTCMTGAGLSAGMIGPLAFLAGIGCSAAQGACMSACTVTGLALIATPSPRDFIVEHSLYLIIRSVLPKAPATLQVVCSS